MKQENQILHSAKIRDAFQQVLEDSLPTYKFKRLQIVPLEDQEWFRKKVDRYLFVPILPNAGDAERQMVKRFEKLAFERDWDGHTRAMLMAQAFKAVLPQDPRNPGCYYVRRPLTAKANKSEYEWVNALIASARISRQWEKLWFGEQLLLGFPKSVSNFRIECLFLLRNSDGLVTRLVRLKNIEGEVSRGPHPSGYDILDARSFCSAERLSEWALARGNNVWDAGVTEVRMLQTDLASESAWRVVTQVDSCGWFPLNTGLNAGPESGIWFFDDCAYADGNLLKMDADGVYWYRGEGYYLSHKGRESHFLQGRPALHPRKTATQILSPGDWKNRPEDQTDTGLLRAFFREVCQRLTETLGGYQGSLALGSLSSYAAAPEIFAKYGSFPGLFIHGQKGSGKSKLTSWLVAFWGFFMHSGISLTERTSTAVGMLQELENYSNLPIWFDEYRDHQIDPGKVSVLRNCFDRSTQAKWSQDGKQREIRTAPVVSGESTPHDAATRSRYPHIQVSAHLRKENHLTWFNTNRLNFFLFARLLMESRAEFVRMVLAFLDNWILQPQLADVEEREKMTYGIAYASWTAMAGLLQSHSASEVTTFKNFMLTFSRSAAKDIASETNINLFMSDLITATLSGEIPLDCFRVESTIVDHPPGATNKDAEGNYIQGPWNRFILFIHPDLAPAHLQIFLRKQNTSIVLRKKDLRDQLAVEPYWVGGDYTKHFPGHGTIRPWGIIIDLHPMGTQKIADEVFMKFKANRDLGDPRKGELFGIIDKILAAQAKKERES